MAEEKYIDKSEPFDLYGLCDINTFIKKNEVQEITNPIFFDQNRLPTADGLLSNSIFGITKEERANRFGYIDLHGFFLHPLIYKLWGSIDSTIKSIVHGIKTYKIDSQGFFVEDPEGETGIKFLKKNIDKIKIKQTTSSMRKRKIQFIMQNKKNMFIDKFLVIPAYYRDVNTENGKIGVGDINKLYNSILIASRALGESQDYGLTLIDSQCGRMQELLLSLYNYFGKGDEKLDTGAGIPGKFGLLHRANLRKTTDYGSRLVITCPDLRVDDIDDLDVDMDYSLVPLASLCVNFLPFIIFYIRRFFENEFSTRTTYPMYDIKTGELKAEVPIKNYQIEFSDERIKKEIDRFVHGTSNRFVPIELPIDRSIPKYKNAKVYMFFKGRGQNSNNLTKDFEIVHRRLTWCDILYQAACEVTKDKHILITRYPIDSFYNQFASKIHVASTVDTEYMILSDAPEDRIYKKYPKIREEDIGTDTSNKFKDSLNLCNGYLDSIGGDYDGDQTTVKGVFSTEANAELEKQMNSKNHYIGLDGTTVMDLGKESLYVMYVLTKTPEDVQKKLTKPEF